MSLKYSKGGVAIALGAAVIAAGVILSAKAAPTYRATKAPIVAGSQTATLAAGCFWSMQAIFQQLKGVEDVEPGYAGGSTVKPSYEDVETGTTGHAETVNITFDPKVITYRDLIRVLLTVRDPTTLNQQGPDQGAQYRSVIFYRNAEQKKIATAMIQQIGAKHLWPNAIVTAVEPFKNFYAAEAYHDDYYNRHPNEEYCQFVIAPELASFRDKFKPMLKS